MSHATFIAKINSLPVAQALVMDLDSNFGYTARVGAWHSPEDTGTVQVQILSRSELQQDEIDRIRHFVVGYLAAINSMKSRVLQLRAA